MARLAIFTPEEGYHPELSVEYS